MQRNRVAVWWALTLLAACVPAGATPRGGEWVALEAAPPADSRSHSVVLASWRWERGANEAGPRRVPMLAGAGRMPPAAPPRRRLLPLHGRFSGVPALRSLFPARGLLR